MIAQFTFSNHTLYFQTELAFVIVPLPITNNRPPVGYMKGEMSKQEIVSIGVCLTIFTLLPLHCSCLRDDTFTINTTRGLVYDEI